jgi:transposase
MEIDKRHRADYKSRVDEMGTARNDDVGEGAGRLAYLELTLATTQTALATTQTTLATVTAERDKVRRAYEILKEHYDLLRRRVFGAKAERIDVTQLELELAELKAKLDAMTTQLGEAANDEASSPAAPPDDPKKSRPKPKGRRDLCDDVTMPEERVELTDPALEETAERIGFEESYKLGYRRGGPVKVVIARATYKVTPPREDAVGDDGAEPVFELVTVKKPKELVERGLLAPSLIAHLLVSKYRFGIPFHRLAEMFRAQGVQLDDGTMCRYAENVGAALGAIVEAMAKEAKATAFCLSTDATGVCIQPTPVVGKRQACRKGHFFVVLADQDHIFFEYQPKHNGPAVCAMFKGFKGFIQADAHAIYDALYRGEAREQCEDKAPVEVGCWSHARRRVWEAATITKDRAAREALLRIHALFELEKQWADLAPQQRHERRQLVSRPMLDDFFAWAEREFARVKNTRGLLATAFGYAVRQKEALRRFLEDGRLPMTNNHSERALRFICSGRKVWLFFSSDDHASAAANLFSLMASCQLHGLDAETYLAEIIRVMPHWPRDRYLELAPKYWARTRARLRQDEIALPIGSLTVPAPLVVPEEQSTAR